MTKNAISFYSQVLFEFIILIIGKPINEKLVWHGPFVLNTQQELEQCFEDYQEGKNGFEGAQQFKSKIRQLKDKSKHDEIVKWIL